MALPAEVTLPPARHITRPDWNGLPVQVGISQASFSTANRIAYFADFELTGTNVDFPRIALKAQALSRLSDVNSNSVNITWNDQWRRWELGDNSSEWSTDRQSRPAPELLVRHELCECTTLRRRQHTDRLCWTGDEHHRKWIGRKQ
jgi:hypothetical protein